MTIVTRMSGDVAILDIEGALTGGEAGTRLREEVVKILDAGHSRILLNLLHVHYMDSEGLGELLASKKAVLVAGAQLKLVRLQKKVYGVLVEANIAKLFDCLEDEGMALESFRS